MVYDGLASCSGRVEDYGIEEFTQVNQVDDTRFGPKDLSYDHVELALGVK